jgi:hypothetical protein
VAERMAVEPLARLVAKELHRLAEAVVDFGSFGHDGENLGAAGRPVQTGKSVIAEKERGIPRG